MRVAWLSAMVIVLCISSVGQGANPPEKNEETWEGRIDLGGGAGLRLVLRVTKASDGTLSAQADSPDQGATGLKVDSITRDKTDLSFSMKKLAAEFSGTLNAEGDTAVGKFKQGGKSFPLTLKTLAPASIEIWEGKLAVGAGIELRLVLNIAKHQSDGSLRATFASPDQTPGDFSTDTITRDKETLAFEVAKIKGAYSGKVNATETEAVGEWKQAGKTFPLTFLKKGKATEVRRPQMPQPPYPYEEEMVTYENKDGGVTLAGTLTTPKGSGPFPAVILISGSGSQDRDESLLGHKPFLVLADHLTRHGVAVLRVDDRGVGGSSGNIAHSTTEDFAGDVLAGITFLKARPHINAKKIGLIGHSEGGIIAPIVAARSHDVAFIVLLAGTGLPGDVILSTQARLIAKAMGGKDDDLDRHLEIQKRLIDVVKTEKDEKLAKTQMDAILEELVKTLPKDQQAEAAKNNQLGEANLAALRTPWFRYFLTFDPRPTLAKVHCPVLAINGEKDLQVPPKENLAEIEKALKSAGNSQVTTRELPGLNHLFQTCKTGVPSEYAQIEETFAPAALSLISDWIRDQIRE